MTSVKRLAWFHCHLKALLLSICVCSVIQPCLAQQQFFSRQSGVPTMSGLAGPTKVDLGDLAEISVPAGCKYIDAKAARTLLSRSGNPAPQNLVGLLVPDSGQWFSIVQLSTDGYVTDKDRARLNPAAILKSIQRDIRNQNETGAKVGASPIPDASWLLPPAYDPAAHTLQYALKTADKDGGSINCVATLLGRRGVLSLTTVLPSSPNPDLAQLNEILKGFAFKAGERYADHEPQDRVSGNGLAELISNSNGATGERQYSMAQILDVAIWASSGLAVLFCGWFLLSIARRRRKARYYRIEPRHAMVTPAVAVAAGNGNGNGNGNGHGGENGHDLLPTAIGQAVPSANGKVRRNRRRHKRKLFSYHAFYSDMVMNLTSSGYDGFSVPFAPQSKTLDDSAPAPVVVNGYQAAGSMSEGTQQLLVQETSRLIESQQKLIEGQRKLIEAQSKLIQEKTRLLDAEAKMLDKQSEFFPEQQLM